MASRRWAAACAAMIITATPAARAAADQPPGGASYHRSEAAKAANLPFSDAVRVGGVLYLNNQIGNLPGQSHIVEGGLEAETLRAMANIDAVLAANGLSRRDLFHCTVTLADMSGWSALNRVWLGLFDPDRLPARNVIGVTALPLGAAVGIECQAAYPANAA